MLRRVAVEDAAHARHAVLKHCQRFGRQRHARMQQVHAGGEAHMIFQHHLHIGVARDEPAIEDRAVGERLLAAHCGVGWIRVLALARIERIVERGGR